MDYADIQTQCEVSFLSVVFFILTIILTVVAVASTSATLAAAVVVILIGICCGAVGITGVKAFSGCSTSIIIWVILTLVTGGIAAGFLLTLVYLSAFFATTFKAAEQLDNKVIEKYENQKYYPKKRYNRRRRKYHRNNRYPQR